MSRAINLALSEDEVLAHCARTNVSISGLEVLPGKAGVRLICCSRAGADQVRDELGAKVLADDVVRTVLRPRALLW